MSIQSANVLKLASELWSEQHDLDLDQIDGSFYFHICQADRISNILREASSDQHHPDWGWQELRLLLPNTQRPIFSTVPSVPRRPGMREAVSLEHWFRAGGRPTPDGDMIERRDEQFAGIAWIRLGIRNQDWRGKQVEAAFRETAETIRRGTLGSTSPPFSDSEAMIIIGARLFRDSEYGFHLYWNPNQEYPHEPERLREFVDSSGRLMYEVDFQDPHWTRFEWGPMVAVSVAEPLPPEGIIAAYYDATVVKQRAWHLELLGASNDQDVPTAIRTWATGLLIHSGLTHRQAVGALHTGPHGIGGNEVSFQRFSADRKRLVARAPEAEPFLRPAR